AHSPELAGLILEWVTYYSHHSTWLYPRVYFLHVMIVHPNTAMTGIAANGMGFIGAVDTIYTPWHRQPNPAGTKPRTPVHSLAQNFKSTYGRRGFILARCHWILFIWF